MNHFLDSDINEIVNNTKNISKYFSGKNILITGGNGFLGKYFVEIFKQYNYSLNKPIKVFVYDVTINKKKLSNSQNIKFIKKDVSKNLILIKKLISLFMQLV